MPGNSVAAAVLSYAQLSEPYVYGATGPNSSGLTMSAYRAAGIAISRLSDAQYWHGPRIPPGQEQPGDLVPFDYKPGRSGPGHVVIVCNPAKAP